jgi:hypothetical protein
MASVVDPADSDRADSAAAESGLPCPSLLKDGRTPD